MLLKNCILEKTLYFHLKTTVNRCFVAYRYYLVGTVFVATRALKELKFLQSYSLIQ